MALEFPNSKVAGDHDDEDDSFSKVHKLRSSILTYTSLVFGIQATLTLRLKHLTVSSDFCDYIERKSDCENFLEVGWSLSPRKEYIQLPKTFYDDVRTKIDYPIKYTFQINEDFVYSLKDNPIMFDLYVTDKIKDATISRSELYINLEGVNKKEEVRLVFHNNKIGFVEDIACLDLWYKFSCNKKEIKEFLEDVKNNESVKKASKRFVQTIEDEKDVSNSLLSLLSQNKNLKASQSEINVSTEGKKCWIQYETTCKESSLFQKSSEDFRDLCCGENATTRLEILAKLKNENFSPVLFITVVELFFLENCELLMNEQVQQIYVEYTFLNQEGPEMEAPFSLPKGTSQDPTLFNWTKSFDIDIQHNYENCKMLMNFIKNNDFIKFMVISEPIESFDGSIQICEEVGYAEVSFRDIVQLESNVDVYQYEILDFRNPLNVVGYITIRFEGILAMREVVNCLGGGQGHNIFAIGGLSK